MNVKYSITFNDNTSARSLELLNSELVPQHVLVAVLTLPVHAPQEANTKYNCLFSH